MNAIILNAGISSARMKTYEPRALLKINDKMIIERQYESLKRNGFKKIRTVVGYSGDKLAKKISHLPIEIVKNKDYEITNNAQSFKLAYRSLDKSVLVVHGDILFNDAALKFDKTKSHIVVDSIGRMKSKEVGIVYNNTVTTLSYGVSKKWCQIAYFTGKEFELLFEFFRATNIEKNLTFEVINGIIDMGGVFYPYESPEMKIFEIDSVGDFKSEKNKDIDS
jgi:CTP:phosphocholine cytidylyltransferase-like protein